MPGPSANLSIGDECSQLYTAMNQRHEYKCIGYKLRDGEKSVEGIEIDDELCWASPGYSRSLPYEEVEANECKLWAEFTAKLTQLPSPRYFVWEFFYQPVDASGIHREWKPILIFITWNPDSYPCGVGEVGKQRTHRMVCSSSESQLVSKLACSSKRLMVNDAADLCYCDIVKDKTNNFQS